MTPNDPDHKRHQGDPGDRGRIRATSVQIIGREIVIGFSIGTALYLPIERFPKLHQASTRQRANCHLTEGSRAIRWDDIDLDIVIAPLVGELLSAVESNLAAQRHRVYEVVGAFEARHGPISDRARGLVGQQWGPIRPMSGSVGRVPSDARPTPPSEGEVEFDGPVLDGEDELVAYLDQLAAESIWPQISELAARIEPVFGAEADNLRAAGEVVDAFVDDLGDQLNVTLKVGREAWTWERRLIVMLNPRFIPHVGARILAGDGAVVADIGESSEADTGIAMALAQAGMARLRMELE
jgi:hypothetical protein